MTEKTRRNVLRYGIAIDLVIVACGVGMLLAAPSPAVLIGTFTAVVALSVWKGGWQGGLTALLLSQVALEALFSLPLASLFGFTAAAVTAGALVYLTMRPRAKRDVLEQGETADDEGAAAPAPFASLTLVRGQADAFRADADRSGRERLTRERENAEREREEAERRAIEEVKRERARLEEERARMERDLAERLELERDEAAREAEQRLRVAMDAERAALRVEAERELATQREEIERAAAERVAAAQAEAAAHEAAEREAIARAEAAAKQAAEREAAAKEAAEREAVARETAAREAAAREAAEREAAAREAAAKEAAEREIAAREAAAKEAAEREIAAAREAAAKEAAEREQAVREAAAKEAAEREQAAREAVAKEAAAKEAAAKEAAAKEAAERDLAARAEAMTEALAQDNAVRGEELRGPAAPAAAEVPTVPAGISPEEIAAAALGQPLSPSLSSSLSPLVPQADALAHPEPAAAPKKAHPEEPAVSLFDRVASWFKPKPRPRTGNVNVTTRRINGNATAPRRSQAQSSASSAHRRPSSSHTAHAGPRKSRLLLLERRRGTADTAIPKLKQRGVEVQVVERWVDAVDELFRFRPDAMLMDIEHPDFENAYRTIAEKSPNMPLVLTGRSSGAVPAKFLYAAFVARPYDVDEMVRVAQQAHAKPEELLAMQLVPRSAPVRTAPRPVAPKPELASSAPPRVVQAVAAGAAAITRAAPAPAPMPQVGMKPASNDEYEVACFTCRIPYNAVDADWCSCLAKERSLVCTNCLSCFCKAPPAYKEKFWVEAPPRLFERKSAEARRQQGSLPANPAMESLQRPLVLAVEDDEDIQSIVHRVCSNLGYGFVYALNGQDGLELAQQYRPNLILSDAFMPKLDGREMCRLLKEDPSFNDCRMVVMTGLYTDTKYRSEALKRFHVDDYIAKPVAVTDLINLLQKHLEGVAGLPAPQDLHELHRRDVADDPEEEDVPLSDLLDEEGEPMETPPAALQPSSPATIPVKSDAYQVRCFNCESGFDATRAEWCRCVGRDNTLVCDQCHGCFCKAPAPYKERFWIDAPPSLFERKMIGSKRNLSARANPTPHDVKRPLILLVEDDENVQLIVRTVVTTMGYGFVVGANGQEGLSLAREYTPDLILSDAFMPKLDGREMCRLLKEDPLTSRSKAIIMTGLYTDRKYRNEALDYFKVDDYVAKPLAVDDLIKLFKKHLPLDVTTAQSAATA